MSEWKFATDHIENCEIKPGTKASEVSREAFRNAIKNGAVLFRTNDDDPTRYELMLTSVVENTQGGFSYYSEKKKFDMSVCFANGYILSAATNRGYTPQEFITKEPAYVVSKYILKHELDYKAVPDPSEAIVAKDADSMLEWLKENGIDISKDKERNVR